MARSLRQSRILDIIAHREINTQEELVRVLKEQGFEVTQATVSRDIRELGLVKVLGAGGRYRYASVSEEGETEREKFLQMFRATAVSAIQAQNLVVVKTVTGSANTAAIAIDKCNIEEIVGSVAGDDTILLVALTSDAAEIVCRKLQRMMR